MKHTIWTIINTIIFMMNLILTGITAVMFAIIADDGMRRDAKRRIEHRNKINSIYGNRHVTYYEPSYRAYRMEEEE